MFSPVTVVSVLVLGSWTCWLIVESIRMLRAWRAFEKACAANDRLHELSNKAIARANESDRENLLAIERCEKLQRDLEDTIERERDYNTEYREKIKAELRAVGEDWLVKSGPNTKTAQALAGMIKRATHAGHCQLLEDLLLDLQRAWPHHDWRTLVANEA